MNAEKSVCENVFRSSTNLFVCEKVSSSVAKPGAGDTSIFIGASAGPRTFARCPYPRGGYNSCLPWCNSMTENDSATGLQGAAA